MKDIRREITSGSNSNRVPIIRSHSNEMASLRTRRRDIDNKVEDFERGSQDDLNYLRRRQIKKPKKSWKVRIVSLLVILILIASIYMLTFVWNSATVNIKARSEPVSQNGIIFFNNSSSTQYEKYEIEDNASGEIKKSSSVDVKSKAKGFVTIYNNFDKNKQKLVKNTRLETANGKIFRIDSNVVIPGKSDQGPGSVRVFAVADTYGDEYNIAASSFNIPGFKGSPKYSSINAKSDTPMVGGDKGKKYIISDQDIKDVESKLSASLEVGLREKILSYKDDKYVIVKDSLTFTHSNNRAELEKSPSLNTYIQKVKASLIIIPRNVLAMSIVKNNLNSYNGLDKVEIENLKDLKVYMAQKSNLSPIINATSTVDVLKDGIIQIGVEYKGNIKWAIDKENLKNELVGKDISAFTSIMSKYVGVDTASQSLRPLWVHTFPSNITRITVKVE